MLPLKPKHEDRSKDWAQITEAEMSGYVGIYENNQSRLEIVAKDGKLLFVLSGTELPMTRIGEHRFTVPRRSANELTFVLGADGKVEYRHTGLRAWKRKGTKETNPAQQTTRSVTGQVLTSTEMPAVRLEFEKEFKYAGSQSFILYDVARAEQHFFIDADKEGRIKRLYWVQFEGYLPSNTNSYRYKVAKTVNIGGLDFIADA